MTDISLQQLGVGQFGPSINQTADDLLSDEGLETAVICSLFTDARSSLPPPDGTTDPRGWWGDVGDADGYELGSLLWTLFREKVTPETVAKAEAYCRQALQWMIDDGIARTVNVAAERAGLYQISVSIEIVRPTGDAERYSYLWDGQRAKFEGRVK